MPYTLADHIERNADGSIKVAERAAGFDDMAAILKDKNIPQGKIFIIEDDKDALTNLVQMIRGVDSFGIKVGVIYKVGGHTTAFCIDKIINEDDEESLMVYNVDSVAMDIDEAEEMRAVVVALAEVADEVYSLGFDDRKPEVIRDYKRQYDISSCVTQVLYDVEAMLNSPDFYEFVRNNSEVVPTDEGAIFNLEKLPPIMMATMQSIYGKDDMGTRVRNGLLNYINSFPDLAEEVFEIDGEVTSINQLMAQMTAIAAEAGHDKITNPLLNIFNTENVVRTTRHALDIKTYNLSAASLDENNKKIAALICDIALAEFEAQEGVSDVEEEEAARYDGGDSDSSDGEEVGGDDNGDIDPLNINANANYVDGHEAASDSDESHDSDDEEERDSEDEFEENADVVVSSPSSSARSLSAELLDKEKEKVVVDMVK